MDKFIKLMLEFEGIIGAILGSVTTLIATELLKSRGKLKLYLKDFVGVFQTYGDVGCGKLDKTDDDFYGFKLKYSFQVYNGTGLPRIMKDFKIVFYKGNKIVYSEVPDNEQTRENKQYYSTIDEMEVFNIYPREIQVLKHSMYIHENDLIKIEGATKVEMIYFDEKGKKKSLLLSTNEISQKNYKPREK